MSSAFERLQKVAEEKRLKQKLEIVPNSETALPYPSVVEPTPPQPTIPHPSIDNKKEVSPTKDFTKVSNSILKQAVPEGLFRGQSKHTYDVLYQKTRGAINPKREVQLTKSELVKATGLEIKTIQRHLSFLKSAGLIKVDVKSGDHKGAIYSVFIPDEATLPYPSIVQTGIVEYSTVEAGVLYTPDPSINSTTLGYGKPLGNEGLTENPNTSLKTNTKNDDDEAFAALNKAFAEACEKISGKLPNKNQQGNWKELAELLIMELEVASARTSSVSNVPAFLTEHLRRRLMPVKRETSKNKPIKSAQIDSPQPSQPTEEYQAEALTKEGRESTLKTFTGYIEKGQKDFLMSLEDTYTPEDWEWLMKELR